MPKTSKQRIPSPPLVNIHPREDDTSTSASTSASQSAPKPKKRRLVDKEQQRRDNAEEIKLKVQEARAIANARMLNPVATKKSPTKIMPHTKKMVLSQKISPIGKLPIAKRKSPVKINEAGMTSPWKVQDLTSADTPSPSKVHCGINLLMLGVAIFD